MRHNDEERRRITQAIAEENQINTLQPGNEDSSNNNKKDTRSVGEPDPCFPCCTFASPIPTSGCCGKRQKEFLKIRIAFRKLVENKWFDNGILILIIASSSVLVSNCTFLTQKVVVFLNSQLKRQILTLLTNKLLFLVFR